MSDGYHHGDLREALIEAALEMVAARGVSGFSMREAARTAGVSPGAPYRHFADNNALLRAAASRVARLLAQTQQEATSEHEDPLLRFRAIGICTVGFAVEHPEWFELMNTARFRDHSDPEIRAQLEDNEQALDKALEATVDEGSLAEELDPAVVMLAVQATTYGLTRMFLDGHLDTKNLDREQVERVAETVLNLLGTGFLDRGLRPT